MFPSPNPKTQPANPIDFKIPNKPVLVNLQAHPELDRVTPADHWWMHEATEAGINARIALGYRLFQLKANPRQPGLFSALFVRNQGSYERTGAGWELGLTEAEVQERVNNPKRRIISICPVVTGNTSVRYGIVFVGNQLAQHWEYKVLTGQKKLADLLTEAQAFGGRIVDVATAVTSTNQQKPLPVNLHLTTYSAVITKNAPGEIVTQWVGRSNLTDLSILITRKNLQEKQPVRLVALVPVTASIKKEVFDYVLETRPADQNNWFLDSLTFSQVDDPDHIGHATRRLQARPIYLVQNADTGRYTTCLIDNGPLSIQGKSTSAAYDPMDQAVMQTLKTYGIPGAVLAIAANGKLIHAKGYGNANFGAGKPATPDTVFRLASISKGISALAVLRLIQDGTKLPDNKTTLSLDTKIFGQLFAASTGTDDQKKLNAITLRHLLEHRTGFHNDLAWLTSPKHALDHATPVVSTPGTVDAYKNGHYHLVYLIVKLLSGLPYESYVRQKLLDPLGIKRMGMSGSLPNAQNLTEANYYSQMGSFNRIQNWAKPDERQFAGDVATWIQSPPERQGASVWAASPIDLVRLMVSVDGSRQGMRVLNQAHFELIANGATASAGAAFRGLAFSVNRGVGSAFALNHNGYLPGSTCAYLRRRTDGLTYCWAINGDSARVFETEEGKKTDAVVALIPEQNEAIWAVDAAVSNALDKLPNPWPGQESDLFPDYGF